MSDVFDELKRIINRSGMSTSALGAKANCHHSTLDLWLEGKTQEPRLATLLRVAAVFGKRIELTNGELRMAPVYDTPATVAAKAKQARVFIGLWRRYQ